MEKSCGRREGINQIGCMWVFISILGFNQKRLLMDMKRNGKKMQLTCSSEGSQDVSIAGDEHVETKICEEKFSEMIKLLIAQKEGEIQTCKDLLEAFQVFGSEEESLLKKVSHEDSQRLGDSKRVVVEEEKPEDFSKQEAVVLPKRKCTFFRRKWRSEERKNRSSQVVVLKTASNSLDVDSSSGNKSKTGRTFSRFLMGLIKRRLHSAVNKKSCDVLVDRSQNRSVQEETESNEEADKEDTVHTSEEDSKKTVSGLYVAARKHLSEMLANGDIDVSLSDKEVPRILGKILSLPEFSSPGDSPRYHHPPHDLVSPISQATEKTLQSSSCTDGLTDEDSDKDDETLFTINVSNTAIEPSSETSSSSITQQVEDVDEEDGDKQSSNKEMLNQAHSSSPESPPSSSVRMTESKEPMQGKLSPDSVLESLLTDDESSPTTSTRFSSGEVRIQPVCIRFDEADDSPKQDQANNLKTSMDNNKELILAAYIEAVVKSSGLMSWEELLTRPFYSEQILEPELVADEIVFSSTQLCDDKNLLNDCINEVLMDFCGNELNPGPWILYLKPELQLISDTEIAAKVAQEGVYWHLLPLPPPHTLDQIVKKDMARRGSWMDLRFDIGWIGSGTSEMILDDLVEEIMRDMVQVGTRTVTTYD